MGLKIIATPDPAAELRGDGLGADFERIAGRAAGRGFTHVRGFRSLAGLFQRIDAELAANPTECLEVVEIYAHGNPYVVDGVDRISAAALGAYLKRTARAARLCDLVEVYLTGCNTAVQTRTQISIAQITSTFTPTEADDNLRVNVFGTVGYALGTNMEGNIETRTEVTVAGHNFPPYPAIVIPPVVSPGSTAASGAAAFRGFREGGAAL
jgi:hypothetical protein